MKQWNRMLILTLVLVVGLSFSAVSISYAGAQDDLNKINAQKEKTKKTLQEEKKKSAELKNNIDSLQSKVNAAQSQVSNIQSNIESTVNQIIQVQANLEKIQGDMQTQNTNMDARLRTMYENGNAGVLEVLLGSGSISDFMTNLDMTQRIFDSDSTMLKQMKEHHAKVAAQKSQLQGLQATLKRQQDDETAKQASLVSDQLQLKTQKNQVDDSIKGNQEDLAQMEKESNALIAQIRAASNNTHSFGGGAVGWPCTGRITSPFGYRIHPITHTRRLHTGIDIGVPTGTPIHAAADGKVITSQYNKSYGYYVAIDHGILSDGKTHLTTLYAHNSKLVAPVGKMVKKGDVVAYSGSTGDSTGPHCHFEVRVNGVPQNPMGWL